MWVAESGDDAVVRIDPGTGEVAAPIDVGDSPDGIVVTDRAVWVANGGDATLSEIDPDTRQVITGALPVGSGPSAVVADAASVWVADQDEGAVDRVDAVRATPVPRPDR